MQILSITNQMCVVVEKLDKIFKCVLTKSVSSTTINCMMNSPTPGPFFLHTVFTSSQLAYLLFFSFSFTSTFTLTFRHSSLSFPPPSPPHFQLHLQTPVCLSSAGKSRPMDREPRLPTSGFLTSTVGTTHRCQTL